MPGHAMKKEAAQEMKVRAGAMMKSKTARRAAQKSAVSVTKATAANKVAAVPTVLAKKESPKKKVVAGSVAGAPVSRSRGPAMSLRPSLAQPKGKPRGRRSVAHAAKIRKAVIKHWYDAKEGEERRGRQREYGRLADTGSDRVRTKKYLTWLQKEEIREEMAHRAKCERGATCCIGVVDWLRMAELFYMCKDRPEELTHFAREVAGFFACDPDAKDAEVAANVCADVDPGRPAFVYLLFMKHENCHRMRKGLPCRLQGRSVGKIGRTSRPGARVNSCLETPEAASSSGRDGAQGADEVDATIELKSGRLGQHRLDGADPDLQYTFLERCSCQLESQIVENLLLQAAWQKFGMPEQHLEYFPTTETAERTQPLTNLFRDTMLSLSKLRRTTKPPAMKDFRALLDKYVAEQKPRAEAARLELAPECAWVQKLFPHQREAIEASEAWPRRSCLVNMAPGAGKTLVMISKTLLDIQLSPGEDHLHVFVFPRLDLLSQFLVDYIVEAGRFGAEFKSAAQSLFVHAFCSVSKADFADNVRKRLGGNMDQNVDEVLGSNFSFGATSSGANSLGLDLVLKSRRPRVIAVTYTSLERLSSRFLGGVGTDAAATGSAPRIKRLVYDEAHHILGAEQREVVFSKSWRNCADKIEYYTGTPAKKDGIDMFDPEVCGGVAFSWLLDDGMAANVLRRFRVLQASGETPRGMVFPGGSVIAKDPEVRRHYAAIIRAMLSNPGGESHWNVLTFHKFSMAASESYAAPDVAGKFGGLIPSCPPSDGTVASARAAGIADIEADFRLLFKKLQATEFPGTAEEWPPDTLEIKIRAMQPRSRDNAGRFALLEDFNRQPENKRIFILASCQTLSEGIDTKHANMVAPVSPGGSVVNEPPAAVLTTFVGVYKHGLRSACLLELELLGCEVVCENVVHDLVVFRLDLSTLGRSSARTSSLDTTTTADEGGVPPCVAKYFKQAPHHDVETYQKVGQNKNFPQRKKKDSEAAKAEAATVLAAFLRENKEAFRREICRPWRATCEKVGEFGVKSGDVCREFGELATALLPDRTEEEKAKSVVSMKNYEMEVVLFMSHKKGDEGGKGLASVEKGSSQSGGETASALNFHVLGADTKALDYAQQLASQASLRERSPASCSSVNFAFLSHCDTRRLPVRTGSVDLILVDPPWGQRHGRFTGIQKNWRKWKGEWLRVLRVGGLLGVVTIRTKHVLQEYEDWFGTDKYSRGTAVSTGANDHATARTGCELLYAKTLNNAGYVQCQFFLFRKTEAPCACTSNTAMEGARPSTLAGTDGVMHQLDLDGLQRKNACLQRDLEAAERHKQQLESEVGFLQTKVKELELERVANLAKMLDDSGTDQNYNGLLKETLEEAETLRTEAETLRKWGGEQGRELERKKQEGEHLKRRIDTLEAANASLEDRLQSAEEKMSVELQKTAEEFSGREAALQHEVEVAKLSAATVSSQIQTLETEMLAAEAGTEVKNLKEEVKRLKQREAKKGREHARELAETVKRLQALYGLRDPKNYLEGAKKKGEAARHLNSEITTAIAAVKKQSLSATQNLEKKVGDRKHPSSKAPATKNAEQPRPASAPSLKSPENYRNKSKQKDRSRQSPVGKNLAADTTSSQSKLSDSSLKSDEISSKSQSSVESGSVATTACTPGPVGAVMKAVRAKHSPNLLRKRDISGSPISGSPHATPKRKLARSTNSSITRADRSSTLVSHTASSSTSTSSSTTKKNKFPANKRSEPPYSDDEEARFSVDQSVELSKPQQQLLRGILKRDVSSPNLHADMPMGRAKTTKRSRALDIDAVSEMIISHATTEPQRSLSRTSGTARMGKGLGMQANSASPSGAGDWKVRKALSTIEDLRTNLEKVTSQYDRERERGDKQKKRIQGMGRKAEKCIAGAAAACGNVGGN
eukprot:g6428.t1